MPSSTLARLLAAAALCHVANASITIVDSGKVLESAPEKHLGTKLWKGYEYIGRLQYVPGNMQLCKNNHEPIPITVPPDGLPVALFAKTGGCSLEEKAEVASTLIRPSTKVAYLIVDDYGRKKKRSWLGNEDDVDDYALSEQDGPFWATQSTSDEDAWVKALWEDQQQQQLMEEEQQGEWFWRDSGSFVVSDDETVKFVQGLEDAVIVSDDETLPPMEYRTHDDDSEMNTLSGKEDGFQMSPISETAEAYTTFVTLNDDAANIHEDEEPPQKHRVLRKHKKLTGANEITVAVLHVSARSGYELLNLVLKQDAKTYKEGGPKILLNNKYPAASARTIFLWTMLTIIFAGGGCCCMMLIISRGVEEPPSPPPRPVRRRLTYDQVRASHPAFRYNPADHVESGTEECAICLDDFEAGQRCRQLPCNHIFHSPCIGRWLIERSATCPLCKIDLYEEEESSEEEGSEAEAAEPEASLVDWMRNLGLISASGTTTTPQAPNTTTTATAPAPTTAVSSSWWGSSGASGRSWWSMRRRTPAPREDADNTTTEGRPTRGGIWRLNFFGRPNRRRDGEGMLTELTEPLMAGESSGAQAEAAAEAQTPNEPSAPEIAPPEEVPVPSTSETTTSTPETAEATPSAGIEA